MGVSNAIFVTEVSEGLTSGQKFMISLLVNSLISHGGLEHALNAAIYTEAKKINDTVSSPLYLLTTLVLYYDDLDLIQEAMSEKEYDESRRGSCDLAAGGTVKTEDVLLESGTGHHVSVKPNTLQLIQQLLRYADSSDNSLLKLLSA